MDRKQLDSFKDAVKQITISPPKKPEPPKQENSPPPNKPKGK
jgi:hypothetical protein